MSDPIKLQALIASIATMTAAYKTALETRTAPDSLKLGGKTLAEITAQFDASTGALVDAVSQELAAFIARRDNPHQVTAEQVGLGNVANIGVASSEEALAGVASDKLITPAQVKAVLDQFWADQVGSSPETLNTIREITAALHDDPEIVNTLTNLIGTNATAITALQGTVADLQTQITTLGTNGGAATDALSTRVGALEVTSAANTTAISDLSLFVDDSMDQLTAQFLASAAALSN